MKIREKTRDAEIAIPNSFLDMIPPWPTWLGVIVLAAASPHITGYMQIATANFFVLLTGFAYRSRNRNAHAILMTAGILSDLALVLILQIQKQAVQTAMSFELSAWNQVHILSSSAATALYIPALAIGFQLFFRSVKPDRYTQRMNLHRRIGWAILFFRTIGFFLMFSMLENNKIPT